MINETVIHAEDVTRAFGDVIAVDHLNLDVRRGEVFGFLGHNGAGKTTTVRLLNGVLAPSGGAVRVLGFDPLSDGPALRRRTGVLTETPAVDDKLTARENLMIYGQLYGVPKAELPERVRGLLAEYELTERGDDLVGGYSKGMRQRLALARTLIHEPELIFLDEPTTGLDPAATRHVQQRILSLSQERQRTVFICTHNLNEAQRLCDRVAIMEHGKLVAMGTPSELARQIWKGTRVEAHLAGSTSEAKLRQVALPELARDVAWQGEEGLLSLWLPDMEAIPTLVESLVAAGIRIYRITPQEPTLEDVYFALHGLEEVTA